MKWLQKLSDALQAMPDVTVLPSRWKVTQFIRLINAFVEKEDKLQEVLIIFYFW